MKAIITLCRPIRRTYIITFTQNGWEIVGNVAMRIKTINFFMSFFHHFYFSLFSLLLLCRYLSLLFIIFHGIFFHMMFSSLQSKIILIQSFHLIYTLLHHFFFYFNPSVIRFLCYSLGSIYYFTNCIAFDLVGILSLVWFIDFNYVLKHLINTYGIVWVFFSFSIAGLKLVFDIVFWKFVYYFVMSVVGFQFIDLDLTFH